MGGNEKIVLTACESDENSFQETIIMIHPDASEGFDFEYDSRFLPGYAPQLYSTVGTEKLSTNSLSAINEETVIPMGFVKNQDNVFSMQLKQPAGGHNIVLVDLKNGIHHHFSQNPIYPFTAASSDNPNRFLLKFSPLEISGLSERSLFKVFSHQKTITVLNPEKQQATLTIYNIAGRKVFQCLIRNERLTIDSGLSPGIYIVNVLSAESITKTTIFVQ
jgi:hypothetical protein